MKEISYLAFEIGNGQIKTNPDKTKAITDFPVSTTIKQLHRFLGLAGWYKRFVYNYGTVSFNLTELLKQKKGF